MSFFISDAMADAVTAAPAQPEASFSLIMIVGIFILFYFMLVRPQSKRAKAQRALMESVKKGDEIITVSGILGKVMSVDDQYLKVNIAEGVEITLQRAAVTTILPKGTLKSL